MRRDPHVDHQEPCGLEGALCAFRAAGVPFILQQQGVETVLRLRLAEPLRTEEREDDPDTQ